MELYFNVIFYMHIIGIALNAIRISTSTYPRVETSSLGKDIILLLVSCSFFAWVVYLRTLI